MKYKWLFGLVLFLSLLLGLFLFNNFRVSAASVDAVDSIRLLMRDFSGQWTEIQDGESISHQQAIRVEVYFSDQSLSTYNENSQNIEAHNFSQTPLRLHDGDVFSVHLNNSLSVIGVPILYQPLTNELEDPYAHYDVTESANGGYDVKTTFSDSVERQQNIHGWYSVEATFSNESANGGTQDIVIDVAGKTYTFPVNAQPIPKAYANFKSHSFNSDKTGIQWNVYANVNNRIDADGNLPVLKQDLTDFTFTDTLDEYQQFVHGSFVVQTSNDMQSNNEFDQDSPEYKSYQESNGDFTVTYSENDRKATINLGNMVGEKIVCVVYDVSLTDVTRPYYENTATLSKIGENDDVIYEQAVNATTDGGASGVDTPTIENVISTDKEMLDPATALNLPNQQDRFYYANNVALKNNVDNYENITISNTVNDVLEPTNIWVECNGEDITDLGVLHVTGQVISFEMSLLSPLPFDFNRFSGQQIQLFVGAQVKEGADLSPYLSQSGTIEIPNTGEVTFNQSTLDANTVFVSIPFQGKIIVADADDNNSILDGARFKITKDSFSQEFSGNELFSLPETGVYTVVQMASPDGYMIDKAPKTFEINPAQSNQVEPVYMVMVENQRISAPSDGDSATASPSMLPNHTGSDEENILPDHIPEGYHVVAQEEPGLYYIYDENDAPLGYVQLSDGETYQNITMDDLISFKKANPKTYDINRSILLLAALVSGTGFHMYWKKRRRQQYR